MSRCIIHIPNKLNPGMASASQIRPQKMIESFKRIGCEVDVVEGTAKERKVAIKRIKKNIAAGIKYDFMYAESSTMPTLLTDPKHLPLHPLLDFGFFKFVKKNCIPIGLFYRDIYWKFPIYKEEVKGIKAAFALAMYKYDLQQYNNYLDKLYMPTERCYKYIKDDINKSIFDVLPPGCTIRGNHTSISEKEKEDNITLLYVGGLGKQYQIKKVLEAIRSLPKFNLIICCREREWLQEKNNLEYLLEDNITIVHKTGDDLNSLYNQADIGVLLFQPDEYREIAMPYKTFEYLGFGLPMIASSNTAVGDFVENQEIGWTIPYDDNALKTLMIELYNNRLEIIGKKKNCETLAKVNKWEDRALKVRNDLESSF